MTDDAATPAVRVPVPRPRTRSLRWAGLLAPMAVFFAIAGPSLAQMEGVPVSMKVAQPLMAALGALAGVGAVYHADGSLDELDTIADENLRLLLLMMALLSIAVSGAWLWLGLMDLMSWLLGSGA